MAGALPPALEVEKNSGSIRSKSLSATSYEFHVNALSKLKNLLSPGSSCREGA